MSTENIFISLP